MTYRAYDRVVASDRPLPELEPAAGTAAITIAWASRIPAQAAAGWTTLWRFSTGEPWVTTARVNGARWLRFGSFADCAISDHRIDVAPRGHASAATLRHLVLDQALPLALASAGALVVHASAVADGTRALLLAGAAGTGKSTLAALMSRQGMQVLADDGALLEGSAPDVRVVPSYPGLRVYRDSAAAAGLDLTRSLDVAEYTRKLRVAPPAGPERAPSASLASIYLLSPGRRALTIEKLSRRDATMAVIANAYRIDTRDRITLETQLDLIAAAAPPVWRVSYPHDLARAADVAAAIAAHARTLG